MVPEHEVRAVADLYAPLHVHALPLNVGHFLEEGRRVENDAVADDTDTVRVNEPRGEQVELEGLIRDDDGVTGVVAPGATRHNVEFSAQHVHNLQRQAWQVSCAQRRKGAGDQLPSRPGHLPRLLPRRTLGTGHHRKRNA